MNRIEKACIERGMRMTEQRRVIAGVLAEAGDHPDVEELHRRTAVIDPPNLDRNRLSHGEAV